MKFYLLFKKIYSKLFKVFYFLRNYFSPKFSFFRAKKTTFTKSEISRELIMHNLLFIEDLRSLESPLQNYVLIYRYFCYHRIPNQLQLIICTKCVYSRLYIMLFLNKKFWAIFKDIFEQSIVYRILC